MANKLIIAPGTEEYTLNLTGIEIKTPESMIQEKDIIGNPTDLTAQNTVLIGAGFRRKRVTLSGYCTISEAGSFEGILNDVDTIYLSIYIGATEVIDDAHESYIMTALDLDYRIAEDRAYYTMELIRKAVF